MALVSHPGIGAAAVALRLKTDIAYDGTGIFTRSDVNIEFFPKGSATAVKFDGTDNKFTGAQLTAGVDLEARGVKASAKAEEITLTLTLNGGTVNRTAGQDQSHFGRMTLDIASRAWMRRLRPSSCRPLPRRRRSRHPPPRRTRSSLAGPCRCSRPPKKPKSARCLSSKR